jgi:hypothetical protein
MESTARMGPRRTQTPGNSNEAYDEVAELEPPVDVFVMEDVS